jgi:hypothetical protein
MKERKIMTSLERCGTFGLTNIRGMAYMPELQQLYEGFTGTPYFDSDFYRLRQHTDFRSDYSYLRLKATISISNYTVGLLKGGKVDEPQDNFRLRADAPEAQKQFTMGRSVL